MHMYGNPCTCTYMGESETPTCRRGSERERGIEVHKTLWARDEVRHLVGFKGSL